MEQREVEKEDLNRHLQKLDEEMARKLLVIFLSLVKEVASFGAIEINYIR